MKKKKRKNNLTYIFIIIILACLITLFCYKNNLFDKSEKNLDNKINENIDSKSNKKEKDPYEVYRKCLNFKLENASRYVLYKENNKNLDYETIVNHVNIGLDKEFYSFIKEADTTKGILILMNKYLVLDKNYEPEEWEEIDSKYFINGNTSVRKLKKEAKEAFEMLSEASIQNGTPVYGQSAYRPYSMQNNLYQNAVSSLGQEKADIDTARPGHSEHQTGLAIDVSSTKGGNMLYFKNTKSYEWMQENAYKYGFILRYKDEWKEITGFMDESWHYRYVGVKVATDMHDNYPNLTYDEYYFKFIDNN